MCIETSIHCTSVHPLSLSHCRTLDDEKFTVCLFCVPFACFHVFVVVVYCCHAITIVALRYFCYYWIKLSFRFTSPCFFYALAMFCKRKLLSPSITALFYSLSTSLSFAFSNLTFSFCVSLSFAHLCMCHSHCLCHFSCSNIAHFIYIP